MPKIVSPLLLTPNYEQGSSRSCAQNIDVSKPSVALYLSLSLFLSADDLLVLRIITYSCFGRRRRSRRILRARFSWERESAAFSPLCRWAGRGRRQGGRQGGGRNSQH